MKHALFTLLRLAFLLIILASCKRIKPIAPKQTLLDSSLTVPLSTLDIPVHYKPQQLQDIVNLKIQGTFMEAWLPLSKKDSIFIKISKSAPIRIRGKGYELNLEIPLKVSGKINKKIWNISIKTPEIADMEVLLYLKSKVDLDQKWQLVSKTEIQKVVWKKEPEVNLGFMSINLRKPVEKAIEGRKEMITSAIDKGIYDGIDTRKAIYKIWTDMQKPILVNKKENKVWIKAYARDLKASLVQNNDSIITIATQMLASVNTLIDNEPVPSSNKELPAYKKAENKPISETHLFILVKIPFAKVNELINKKMKNQTLEAQGYSAIIKNILVYGTKNDLAVKVDMKGDVKGSVFMRGKPYFDTTTNKLFIQDFAFDVDTENSLVNATAWLANSTILNLISDYLQLSADSLIGSLPGLIENGIENGKAGDKINTHVGSLKINPYQQLITKNDFQIILEAKANFEVELEQKAFMKNKKKLKIQTGK